MVTAARNARRRAAIARKDAQIAMLTKSLQSVVVAARGTPSAYSSHNVRAARPSTEKGKGLSNGVASQYAPHSATSAVPHHVLPATADVPDYGGI
jgi:hypothetical protein